MENHIEISELAHKNTLTRLVCQATISNKNCKVFSNFSIIVKRYESLEESFVHIAIPRDITKLSLSSSYCVLFIYFWHLRWLHLCRVSLALVWMESSIGWLVCIFHCICPSSPFWGSSFIHSRALYAHISSSDHSSRTCDDFMIVQWFILKMKLELQVRNLLCCKSWWQLCSGLGKMWNSQRALVNCVLFHL